MDIAQNLSLSYEEQIFLQLDELKKKLLVEDYKIYEYRKLQKQRLFKNNIYESLDIRKERHLKKVLCYILKSLGEHVHNNLQKFRSPSACSTNLTVVDRREMKNYFYDRHGVIHLKSKDRIKFTTVSSKGHGIILHVVAKVLKLLETNSYMSKRELYYVSLNFCKMANNRRGAASQSQTSQSNSTVQPHISANQQNSLSVCCSQNTSDNRDRYSSSRLDRVLDDICCLVGCSKVHLHLLPQTKGIVYGNLKFRLRTGEEYDCSLKKEGTSLPTAQVPIVKIESDAKVVLVLEKDSVLQKILNREDLTNFVKKYKIILVTGKGFPDVNTRAFINFLWLKLKIPVMLLTDADPNGLEIVCSYKFGSYTTAYEGLGIAVPQAKWLGLLPGDVLRLGLTETKTLPMTSADVRKIESIMARPYMKKRKKWLVQLKLMKDMGRKAELEALDTCDDYLVRTYLPNKLRYASWL